LATALAAHLSIHCISAAHAQPVATAIATVIAISTTISHTHFAFSSLRFQFQIHLMSL